MIWSALLVGLAGSTHCIGMCGPLVLALPIQKNLFWIFYHVGRIIMYGILGLLMGVIGKGLWMTGIQNQISIGLGVLLIFTGIFSRFQIQGVFKIRGYQFFYHWIKGSINFLMKKKGGWSIFLLGLLNGLLPCGLVYLALAGAFSSTGIIQATLYMIFFGIGTFPLMGIISLSGKIISGKWREFLRKLSPILWIIFGIFLVFRGLKIDLPDSFRLNPTIQEAPMCH